MHEGQIRVSGETLEFYEVDAVYLPKICLICGKTTEHTVEKSLTGDFSFDKEKRKDYHLRLPICETCHSRVSLTKSENAVKIILFSLLGMVSGFVFYYFTLSIFIAIMIFALSFVWPFLYYTAKNNKLLFLDRFLQLKTTSLSSDIADDVLQMKFFNENYKNHVVKLNLEQNKSLKMVNSLKLRTLS